MKFQWRKNDKTLGGKLIYRSDEYSIDFICASSEQLISKSGSNGCMPLIAGALQIEVGIETKTLLYPWGFLPLINLDTEAMEVPNPTLGSVYVHTHEIYLMKGVALEIPGSNIWKTIKIRNSDYIYIGPDNYNHKGKTHIEFSTNTIIGLENGNMACIFLKPENQEK